jgi:hypothetical protein
MTGLPLWAGDQIRIEGIPNGQERASLDHIEVYGTRRYQRSFNALFLIISGTPDNWGLL